VVTLLHFPLLLFLAYGADRKWNFSGEENKVQPQLTTMASTVRAPNPTPTNPHASKPSLIPPVTGHRFTPSTHEQQAAYSQEPFDRGLTVLTPTFLTFWLHSRGPERAY
jgi:hypothetical protein